MLRTEILPTDSGSISKGRFDGRGGKGSHEGVDLKADVGTPVYSAYDGIIGSKVVNTHVQGDVWSDTHKGNLKNKGLDYNAAGNRVYVESMLDGDKYTTGYWHLSSVAINPNTGKVYAPGDKVKQGDIIGYTGSTGNANGPGSGGPHLHYQLKVNGVQKDPEEYMPTKYDTQGQPKKKE